MKKKKEGREQLSFIFGIISLVMAFFNPVAGVVFGIIGLFQNENSNPDLKKNAKTMNILGVILGVILTIVSVYVAYSLQSLNLM